MPDPKDRTTEDDLTNLARTFGKAPPERVRDAVVKEIEAQEHTKSPVQEALDRYREGRERDDLERG